MKTMNNVVEDILSLSNTDIGVLAEALALFDIRKADRLKFLLSVAIEEEDMRRLKDWNAMKDAAQMDIIALLVGLAALLYIMKPWDLQ